ncbi:MAG: hypothetical protein HY671_11240 [Chloroflexi bacterium]|nr:hypothetical protein [Chloroflexota bacterium]
MRKWLWIGIVALLVIGLAVGGGTALANRDSGKVVTTAVDEQAGFYLDSATLTRVATVLGVTPTELTAQLQAGKTLAQVAKDKGVDTAKVVEAILAPHKDQLQLNLKYGYITQAQADAALASARQAAESVLDRTFNTPGVIGAPGAAPSDHMDEAMIKACRDMMASGGMGNMMGGQGSGMMGGGAMGPAMMGNGMMGPGMMGGGMMGRAGTTPQTQSGFGSWGRGMMGGWW